VVVPAVYVREAKDEIGKLVTPGVGVDHRLARDLRGRVRRLREREVGLTLLGREAMNVAVDLAARGEHDRNPLRAAELQDVERQDGFREGGGGGAEELMTLRVRGQVPDEIDRRILDPADSARERGIVP